MGELVKVMMFFVCVSVRTVLCWKVGGWREGDASVSREDGIGHIFGRWSAVESVWDMVLGYSVGKRGNGMRFGEHGTVA